MTLSSVCLVAALVAAGAGTQDAGLPIAGLVGATFGTADPQLHRDYYGRRAGFPIEELPGGDGAIRVLVGEQWLEMRPGFPKDFVVRLESVTMASPDLAALREQLSARGVTPTAAADSLSLEDPSGHVLRFVTPNKARRPRAGGGFSTHLQHLGLAVARAKEEATVAFYRDTLGFAEVFRMSDKAGRLQLVKFRLPGPRFDVIELIVSDGDKLNKWAAGAIYHANFAVKDIDRAFCQLAAGALAYQDGHRPKVNAERLWAIDVFDPELMRVEIQVTEHAKQEIGEVSNPRCGKPNQRLVVGAGKDLSGWKDAAEIWRREGAEIVGRVSEPLAQHALLWSETVLRDFYLSVRIKQTPGEGTAGIHFRSQRLKPQLNQAKGYRADVGPGAWGRLFHEQGRAELDRRPEAEAGAKPGDWNRLEILAVGRQVWTAVNGKLAAAYEDPKGELTGFLALELHVGPAREVRFRDLVVVQNPRVTIAGLTGPALLAALRKPVP